MKIDPVLSEEERKHQDWWPTKVTETKEKLGMSKRHYIAIAAIVERNNLGNNHLVDDLVRMFQKDNPSFDLERFVVACGRIPGVEHEDGIL